jgi:hypothetical protein
MDHAGQEKGQRLEIAITVSKNKGSTVEKHTTTARTTTYLATARGRNADHVPALEGHGPTLRLNRRRLGKAALEDFAQHVFGHAIGCFFARETIKNGEHGFCILQIKSRYM